MSKLKCPNCRSTEVLRERRPNGNTRCQSCTIVMPSVKWDEMCKILKNSQTTYVTIAIESKRGENNPVDQSWVGHDFQEGGTMVVTSHGHEMGIISAIVTKIEHEKE